METDSASDLRRRARRAVPIGLVLGAMTWVGAVMGVHAYDAPKLQWVLMFPGVLCGPAAMLIHAAQWVGYAFLAVSIYSLKEKRPYVLALSVALVLHIVAGLATA